jgi:hypothetical protein
MGIWMGDFMVNPFWYSIVRNWTELVKFIVSGTDRICQTLPIKEGFGSLLLRAAEKSDLELIKRSSDQCPREHRAAISAFAMVAGCGQHEAMKLILESSLTSFERVGVLGLANALLTWWF